jgi:hypothetical protein
MFIEDLTRDLFDEFMKHLSTCAISYRASAEQENRRIALTNLKIIHITIQILMLLLIFNKHTEVLKGKNNTHYNTDSNVITYLQ